MLLIFEGAGFVNMSFLKNADPEKLQKFADHFAAAESQIKIVEYLDKELIIPSVNQLRYAGYHVARAISSLDPVALDEHLGKAINHCKRSYYDTKEVAVIYLLEKIEAFQNDFRTSAEVLKVMPNYCDLIVSAQEASDHIESVKNNHYDNREEFYTSCDPHYDILKSIVDKFSVARPLILKETEKERNAIRRTIIATVISALTLLVLILKTCQELSVSSRDAKPLPVPTSK